MSLESQIESPLQSLEFGKRVQSTARLLASEGKDANQIAKILCDADPEGHNYGIGIVLDSEGRAMATSETLLRHTLQEVEGSQRGNYQSSSALLDDLKVSVLRWQRIPESLWEFFVLILPSDAGTGAVKSAVEIALTLDGNLSAIGVEELGWPAYAAIAKSCRVGFQEFPVDCVIVQKEVLPIYQAGPMNTTGRVTGNPVLVERAKSAVIENRMIILDRAYPGFEFATLLETHGYEAIMRMSYERQLGTFLERSMPVLIVISPTKCFRSFALRPAGLLLAFVPDHSLRKQVAGLGNVLKGD